MSPLTPPDSGNRVTNPPWFSWDSSGFKIQSHILGKTLILRQTSRAVHLTRKISYFTFLLQLLERKK